MNRYIFLFLAATLVCFIFSCGPEQGPASGEFIITGEFRNSNGEMIRLYHIRSDSVKVVDSAVIDNKGRFGFSEKITDVSFYTVGVAADNFVTLLISPGEDIVLRGNLRQMGREYSVTGSPGSSLILGFSQQTRAHYAEADSLHELLFSKRNDPDYAAFKTKTDSLYAELFNRHRDFTIEFVEKNMNSLASVFALLHVFGRQRVVSERDHFPLYEKTDSILTALYPENEYVKDFHQRVADIKNAKEEFKNAAEKLDSGMTAPNLSLKNWAGQPQPLSSMHGRYTLLFFWSSGSRPSINALEELKWIQKKYASKGFQIYAVALEKNRQDWEDAIRGNKLHAWTHVTDLLEWKSPSVKIYCVEAIPYFVLISPQGTIIHRSNDMNRLPAFLYAAYKF
jgi:hypothetical protein